MKTAILCRTNAPLVTCAFDLIRKGRGIKVRMIGRDISKRLTEIVGEILDYRRNAEIDEFLTLLDAWITEIHAKYGDSEKHEEYVAESDDHYACLKVMCENSKDATSVYKVIDEFFVDSDEIADTDDSVILCSGHRAKGLEWDRTVVIRADLLPHPAAKSEADIKQEEHLKYVMLTRGKEEMIICGDREPV